MVKNKRYTSFNPTDFHLQSPGGQPVQRAYTAIQRHLSRQLSQAHADLFAEPVESEGTGRIDWYGPAGTVSRLNEVPEAERAAAESRLHQLWTEISAHARRLAENPDPREQRLATYLESALNIPDADHVYLADGQPVITGWGAVRSGDDAAQHTLTRMLRDYRARQEPEPGKVPPEPPGPPEPPETGPEPPEKVVVTRWRLIDREHPWPGAVLAMVFVALLVVTGDLLLRHCAVALPHLMTGGREVVLFDLCTDRPGPNAAASRMVASLERELAGLREACAQARASAQPTHDHAGDTLPALQAPVHASASMSETPTGPLSAAQSRPSYR